MSRLSRAKQFYRQQQATSDAVSPPPATTVNVSGLRQSVPVKTLDPLAFALLESVPELPKPKPPKPSPTATVSKTASQSSKLGALAGGFLGVAGGLLVLASARGAK